MQAFRRFQRLFSVINSAYSLTLVSFTNLIDQHSKIFSSRYYTTAPTIDHNSTFGDFPGYQVLSLELDLCPLCWIVCWDDIQFQQRLKEAITYWKAEIDAWYASVSTLFKNLYPNLTLIKRSSLFAILIRWLLRFSLIPTPFKPN